MNIGKTLYVRNRAQWRSWLQKHHGREKEIWLVYYKKESGKPRIPYNDAVEEALCFGWIDSIVKKIDAERFTQRFSPRKNSSKWSEMNKERIRRLLKQGKMTPSGLAKAKDVLGPGTRKGKAHGVRFVIPPDILWALKRNKTTWKHFIGFPESYKRIRVGWIDGSRNRPDFFRRRLNYFLKMTAQNKRFGMVQ